MPAFIGETGKSTHHWPIEFILDSKLPIDKWRRINKGGTRLENNIFEETSSYTVGI